jgi:hypothetical protein
MSQIVLPNDVIVCGFESPRGNVGEKPEDLTVEISPNQFRKKSMGMQHGQRCNLPDAYSSISQMQAQPGGPVPCWKIPVYFIVFKEFLRKRFGWKGIFNPRKSK